MNTLTTIDEIRDVFLAWILAITNRPTILANFGAAAKISAPYVSLLITNIEMPGSHQNMLDDVTDVETIDIPSKLTLQLDIYGGNYLQDAVRLKHSLYAADRTLDIYQKCGLSGSGPVQDLSSLETGMIKKRAMLTINIYCALFAEFNSSDIDDLPVELDVDDKEPINFQGNENPICDDE